MSGSEILLPVRDYDLSSTLDSGQVFRWEKQGESWTGIVGRHLVQLTQTRAGVRAETAAPVADWRFLHEFLQAQVDLASILKTFPDDEPLRMAVAACHGLRVLRQEPWECLASFILSSTKQIVQIRQIVSLLCERFGEPLNEAGWAVFSPPSSLNREDHDHHHEDAHGLTRPCDPGCTLFSFPSPQRIAAATEAELRACKMGFRAPGLLHTARQIADGEFDLEKIRQFDHAEARAKLMALRGVGAKIADCVLLFAYGRDEAFPVDVWVERALQRLYFPRRRAGAGRIHQMAATHFGPHAGYAQQYLFHYMRTKSGRGFSKMG